MSNLILIKKAWRQKIYMINFCNIANLFITDPFKITWLCVTIMYPLILTPFVKTRPLVQLYSIVQRTFV